MKKNHKKRWKRLRKKFPKMIVAASVVLLSLVVLGGNFLLQMARKPLDALSFFEAEGSLPPEETWRRFEGAFRENSTKLITPHTLAALSQVESGGRSWASGTWQFEVSSDVSHLYGPPSSSFGLMQFTAGTFDRVKGLCIHNHRVVQDGPWYRWDTCWFTWLKSRMSARSSIETAAAYLHEHVMDIGKGCLNLSQEKAVTALAGVIHLCGSRRAKKICSPSGDYGSQHCGRHSVDRYVKRLWRYEGAFKRLDREAF